MNEYIVHTDNGNSFIVKADAIKETQDVVLFLVADEIVGIAPLLNIVVVNKTRSTPKDIWRNKEEP